jgi:hypothetical protein
MKANKTFVLETVLYKKHRFTSEAEYYLHENIL